MSDHPVGEGRDERPPSARARAELSAGLASDVADARLRLEEAVLRAEGHRLLGDEQGLRVALADQDRIVQGLRERLGRTTSAAVLQRDAEEVVAAAASDVAGLADVPDDVRVVMLDDAPVTTTPRHAPLLSGVASLVALVAIAGAIVLGTGQGPSSPGLLEVAGQLDEVERLDASVPPTTSSVPDTAPGTRTERAADPTAAPAGPTEGAPATDAPATEQAADGQDDAEARTLERIIEELNEVAHRFGLDPSSSTDLRIRGDEDGTEADGDEGGTEADDDADPDGTDEDADGTGEDGDESRLGGFVRDSDDE
jgi:hypothetical protein